MVEAIECIQEEKKCVASHEIGPGNIRHPSRTLPGSEWERHGYHIPGGSTSSTSSSRAPSSPPGSPRWRLPSSSDSSDSSSLSLPLSDITPPRKEADVSGPLSETHPGSYIVARSSLSFLSLHVQAEPGTKRRDEEQYKNKDNTMK